MSVCSMPFVNADIHHAIEQLITEDLDEAERIRRIDDSRVEAANLVNAPSPEGIIYASSVTTAMSIAQWLSQDYGSEGLPDPEPVIVMTDCENPSTVLATKFMGDHSHAYDKFSLGATFDPWGVAQPSMDLSIMAYQRSSGYIEASEKRNPRFIHVFKENPDSISKQIRQVVPKKGPCTVIISRVLKQTGKVLPVGDMTEQIKKRNPEAIVIIDDAQAVGNLEEVDMQDTCCDFSLYAGHKFLRGRPIGVAAWNMQNTRIAERIGRISEQTRDVFPICNGTFHSSLGVQPNAEEYQFPFQNAVGLQLAAQRMRDHGWLTGQNSFAALNRQRAQKRKYCRRQLYDLKRGIEAVDEHDDRQSNGILAFRVGDVNSRHLNDVEGEVFLTQERNLYKFRMLEMYKFWHAWRIQWESMLIKCLEKKEVEMQHLAPRNLFRVSFGEDTDYAEIDRYIAHLDTALGEMESLLHSSHPWKITKRTYLRMYQLMNNHVWQFMKMMTIPSYFPD